MGQRLALFSAGVVCGEGDPSLSVAPIDHARSFLRCSERRIRKNGEGVNSLTKGGSRLRIKQI